MGGWLDCADLPAVICIALQHLLSECWQEEPNIRLPMRLVIEFFALLEKNVSLIHSRNNCSAPFSAWLRRRHAGSNAIETRHTVKAIVDSFLSGLVARSGFDLYPMNKRATLEQMLGPCQCYWSFFVA